jgi:hypothetical protein
MKDFDFNLFDKGIDIDSPSVRQDSIEMTGVEEKLWFTKNKTKYIFKIDNELNLGFYELVASYLCNKVGINCVNAYPAVSKSTGRVGVAVQSYITNTNTSQINLSNFVSHFSDYFVHITPGKTAYSVQEICEILGNLKDAGYIVNCDAVANLKDMCIVDYLLFQVDRHFGNIEFLFTKKDGKCFIDVAPMFDNGRCLNFDCTGIMDMAYVFSYDEVKLVMSNRQDAIIGNDIYSKNVAYFISKELLNDNRLAEVYQKLKKFDFDGLIDYASSIYPTQIKKSKLDVAKKTYKIRIAMLEKYLKYAKKGVDNKFKKANVLDARIKISSLLPRYLVDALNYESYKEDIKYLERKNHCTYNAKTENTSKEDLIW